MGLSTRISDLGTDGKPNVKEIEDLYAQAMFVKEFKTLKIEMVKIKEMMNDLFHQEAEALANCLGLDLVELFLPNC